MLASSAASLITTFLPTSRTMLAMGGYRALPKKFATIHPRYKTPAYATVVAGIGRGAFYAVLTFVSEKRADRHDLLARHHDLLLLRADRVRDASGTSATSCSTSFNSFIFKLLFPLLGGLGLCCGLRRHLARQCLTRLRQRRSIFGVGLVLILGLGLILLGMVFMLWQRAREPAYFRGETLDKDTPVLIID